MSVDNNGFNWHGSSESIIIPPCIDSVAVSSDGAGGIIISRQRHDQLEDADPEISIPRVYMQSFLNRIKVLTEENDK